MLKRWLWLLLIVPLLELWLLIEIGARIGGILTLLLVVATAVIGVALVRLQGIATLTRAAGLLASGELPALPLLEAAVLLVAGFLLLIPGFLTDAAGAVLLVPAARRWLLGRFVRLRRVAPPPPAEHPRIVDGESRRLDKRPRGE